MDIRKISPYLSVSPQISPGDVGLAASQGFTTLINNRPDGESEGQVPSAELAALAEAHGLDYHHLPVVSGKVTDADAQAFERICSNVRGPVLAFCRTGTRSTTLWALSNVNRLTVDAVLQTAQAAGYDLSGLRDRLEALSSEAGAGPARTVATGPASNERRFEVVVVGGGAAGISVAASLLKRRGSLDVAIIEPRDEHFYQPGWTLVGGGVFARAQTVRPMAGLIPPGANWIRSAVASFQPDNNRVLLEDGTAIGYRVLVVAPGIKLDWDRVEGLRQTLGRNGVTSNYQFDMAAYTWELVQATREGRAIFTQPPMPIKCAGAPQKALYLSADHWQRQGRLHAIDIEFCNAGQVLFGVPDYVPALTRYIERYRARLSLGHNLVAIDGPGGVAYFDVADEQGTVQRVEKPFDMIHVCPPQCAPDFIRESQLADAAGWVEVNPETLQHARYGEIFALGDACSAPNAKTAAAVRKQAPVVAENVLCALDGRAPRAVYDGYGSCPLTVERGRIVLAEFGYGGKLLPTFPAWLIDGKNPSRLAWFLKEKMLPPIYWHAMLRGREWLAGPTILPYSPGRHEMRDALNGGRQNRP